jgi:hypothetical protein
MRNWKSALPSTTDIVSQTCQVRKVPQTEVEGRHSITSSASTRRVGGIIKSRAFAVLMLILRTNLAAQ